MTFPNLECHLLFVGIQNKVIHTCPVFSEHVNPGNQQLIFWMLLLLNPKITKKAVYEQPCILVKR